MNKLIFANLLHRPLRSVISVLAVAIEVVMILSIVGVFMGMLNEPKVRTNGIGADLMLLPSNASLFTWSGSASMPVKDAEVAAQHATRRGGFARHPEDRDQRERGDSLRYRLPDTFNALKPFVFLSGGKFAGPYDVIIDDIQAGTKNPATGKPYAVGDTLTIMDRPFRVSGIVEQGKGGRKLIPLETMQNSPAPGDMVSTFLHQVRQPGQRRPGDRGDSLDARLWQQHADHGRQLARPDDAG